MPEKRICSTTPTEKQTKQKTSDLLLSRALHVITLQLHGLAEDDDAASRTPSTATKEPGQAAVGGGSGAGGARAAAADGKGSSGTGAGVDDKTAATNEGARVERIGDQDAFFAAITEGNGKGSCAHGTDGWHLKGGKGGGGSGGRGGGGDAVVAEETSICELLGRVARDHGGLGSLFEDGLQVRSFWYVV